MRALRLWSAPPQFALSDFRFGRRLAQTGLSIGVVARRNHWLVATQTELSEFSPKTIDHVSCTCTGPIIARHERTPTCLCCHQDKHALRKLSVNDDDLPVSAACRSSTGTNMALAPTNPLSDPPSPRSSTVHPQLTGPGPGQPFPQSRTSGHRGTGTQSLVHLAREAPRAGRPPASRIPHFPPDGASRKPRAGRGGRGRCARGVSRGTRLRFSA